MIVYRFAPIRMGMNEQIYSGAAVATVGTKCDIVVDRPRGKEE